MTLFQLSNDEMLTTTRSVRKRLDFERLVEPAVIRECLELALQAPTGGNSQGWQFVVVTDLQQRKALADVYRKGWALYLQHRMAGQANLEGPASTPEGMATLGKILRSAIYLAEHMHEVPVLVVPCIQGRPEGLSATEQAGFWGSILPAAWSFMLAARSRGLGSSWTTVHLYYEQEAAYVLGIPYDKVSQAALIPVAYTLGTDFKPASRMPLDSILHWDRW
ncbi:MAG: nitroreductase family protein [Ktedonobacteraceae bacterium]